MHDTSTDNFQLVVNNYTDTPLSRQSAYCVGRDDWDVDVAAMCKKDV